MRRLKEKYADIIAGKRVICLNIPDKYEFMDEKLIEFLKEHVNIYL